ncbi:hypothetical protein BZL30_8155 [Mycobacterium kansasii]|uniref:Uncharacterized protein n=1 Tax=Mycobacterium kansasii TaxID=1768 RepID=A0A1V3XC77_MYCKA|nr:hypothetical protein BZL30_8155 [Mycobacterium kansasii]OOK76805.1 hypothetical protein BZL29_3314 [Mycobacterium kansasii]
MFSDHASSPVDPQTASRSSTATAIPRDPGYLRSRRQICSTIARSRSSPSSVGRSA